MPIASFNGIRIGYESHGAGEPVLLVPGLGGVGAFWTPNLPAFSARYRAIVHDHRGTGQSDRPVMKYSVQQMADDVLGLMDALEIPRAHIVGFSAGGAIGQILAVDHPERVATLTLYASWTRADAYFRRVFDVRQRLLDEGGVGAYTRGSAVFMYPPYWVNANIAKIESREAAGIPFAPIPEIITARMQAVLDFDREADLGRIRQPTLVTCAKDDIITPPHYSEALASRIPGATLAMLERGGHGASDAEPEAFNRVVLDFLAKHPLQ
jgi:aminoacrylate hydrolase